MKKKELVSFAIIPFVLVWLLECYFCSCNFGIWITVSKEKTFLLSIIICYCLFLAFWGITRKTYKSILILSILFFIFSVINQIKIAYTGEPIVFADILYLKNSDELLGIVGTTIWGTIKSYILSTVVYLDLLIIIDILAFKNNVEIKSKKVRICTIIISIILLVAIFLPIKATKRIILKDIYEIDERKDYLANTTNVQYYATNGVIAGMYGQLLENRIDKPEDYNEKEINESLHITQKSNGNLGKPNIVVVFSESFWDIEKLDEVKFDKTVTMNLQKLKKKGRYFEMISPSYGGVSANVEFEFLTGANLMYFNYGYVPYMQLYRNKSYYNKPSIISELKNNGYKTAITTCASEKLFDCGKFYKYLGIDETEFLAEVDESEKKGKYISDESITNRIIKKLETKPSEEKLFYMMLTMQSHMPYWKEKYDDYNIDIVKSDLPQDMNDTLLSYAQGIYDADKELGRLYEYIQTINEPTIIVFYGDHLPYLSTVNGKDIMKSLKYFNTEDKLLNEYRKYNTQALMVANFEMEPDSDIQYLGPDLLGTYILNNMDIRISNYYQWLYTTKEQIGAANWKVAINQNGVIYNTNELNDEMEKLYKLRKNVQYKYFIK